MLLMKFRGKLTLNGVIIAHHVEGEIKEAPSKDGRTIYRGHFATMESVAFSKDAIYRLEIQNGQRTKIKVRTMLSEIAGLRVYSCYATHPFA